MVECVTILTPEVAGRFFANCLCCTQLYPSPSLPPSLLPSLPSLPSLHRHKSTGKAARILRAPRPHRQGVVSQGQDGGCILHLAVAPATARSFTLRDPAASVAIPWDACERPQILLLTEVFLQALPTPLTHRRREAAARALGFQTRALGFPTPWLNVSLSFQAL